MQELIKTHRAAFEAFLAQREHGLLIIRAAGVQIGYAIQILRAIEMSGSPHVFLAFAHDFVSAEDFASLVVERVKATESAVREELGSKARNMQPLPEACLDTRQEPVTRIQRALLYARSLLPAESGKKLICAFLPMVIHNPSEYSQLMRSLAEPGGIPAWYRGMRFLLREDTDAPMFAAGIPPLAQTHDIEFSPETISASLERDSIDPNLPREQQAQALFQLATLDYGHGRYPNALNRFFALLGYYQETDNATMQALTLIGIGDVYGRQGDLAEAKGWYERAIPSATESQSMIALFTLARNLGQIAFQTQNFKDAETYFDLAQQVAPHVYDADGKIQSLEWRALSQAQLSAYTRARQSLHEALAAARQFNKPEHETRITEHLAQLAGMN